MKRRQIQIAVLVPLMMSLSSGCLWAPGLDNVRKDIERQLPGASFDRQFAISLGPLAIGVARTVVGLVPDAREAHEYLRDVSSVKLAIYEASHIPRGPRLTMPQRLVKLVEEDGWEVAVRASQEGDTVWLLYRADGDVIKEIYLVVLNDDELVVVTARGRFDRLLAKAMREHRLPGYGGFHSI